MFCLQWAKRITLVEKMVWSNEELELFIDHVQKNPVLYDHSKPEYYDDEVIHYSWLSIAGKLGRRGSQIRSTWRYIKNIYTWLLRNEDKLCTGHTWPHMEKMKFLKPFVGECMFKIDGPNYEELIDYDATIETGVAIPAFITPVYSPLAVLASDPENLEGHTAQDNQCGSPLSVSNRPVQHALNGIAIQKNLEIEEALCQYLKKKVAKQKDPNELFLSSVAHDMKMLSNQDQAVFKMKVQQLLVEMISKSNDEVK